MATPDANTAKKLTPEEEMGAKWSEEGDVTGGDVAFPRPVDEEPETVRDRDVEPETVRKGAEIEKEPPTIRDVEPVTLREAPDTIRQPAEEEHKAILADEQEPVTLKRPEVVEEQEPVTLRKGEKTPEYYAHKEGPEVIFPNREGKLIDGILVEWEDDQYFRVVGFDGIVLISDTFSAEELYGLKGKDGEKVEKEEDGKEVNPNLKGEVDDLKDIENQSTETQFQIRARLKSILEPTGGEQAA